MQFEETITINAPKEAVFAAYANVSGWPDWDPDVISAQLDGPFEAGISGKLKPKQGPESKITLINVNPDKSFTVECRLPLCRMHFEHELNPQGDSTEVTNKILFSGLLAPIFGRIIGKEIKDTLPGSLQGLKKHLEG